MNVDEANIIINGYANWWKSSVNVVQEENVVRLICPMMDRHNDHMSLYIADDSGNSNGLILSDLGNTLSDLLFSGCDVFSSEARNKKLDQTLLGYGIQRSGNELFVKTSRDNLFQMMNMLMQAMATIDDLFFTVRDNVRSMFLEDIANWFDKNNIRYTKNAKFSGISGFETRFDFVIPKTNNIAPERLIKGVGSPSENSVKNALFGWNDISKIRGDSKSYLFLNAGESGSNKISPSLVKACEAYNVQPVSWMDGSAEESVLEELAA